MSTFARAVAEVFGDEVLRHRALASHHALDDLAVTFSVERDLPGGRGFESATVLIRTRADVVDGNVSLPGLPFIHVLASEEALRALFTGKGDASALAMLGELKVEGDTALLTELAACFRKGESALSIRLKR